MSLALYRKYRPATFAEVKGQEHVTEPLQQALRNGRINHAYLFSGPRGCGKTSSARILARSLNCASGPTAEPCGVCESCVALGPNGAGSIDVIEIDAASHGGVDDARDLREKAFYAPVNSQFKVYIIDEAHMVTREGFNALLKLVEEPPPHLKFVFATTEPEKVIGTIRSRTHHYPFRLVPPGTLRDLLEEILHREEVPFEPTALPLVVRAGAGSVRDSQSILDQLLAGADASGITYQRAVSLLGYTDASLLDEVVDAFAERDGAEVFRAIDRVIEGGHDPRRFAADLLERFRDLVVLAAVPDADTSGLLDAPSDRLAAMRRQAERMGQAELTRAAEVLNAGLTEMRGATAPRLLLELTCARVLLPAASDDAAALLARLEQVERRLSSTGAPPAPDAPVTPRAAAPPERPAEPAAARAEPAYRAAERPAPAEPAPPVEGGSPAPDRRQAPDQPTPPVPPEPPVVESGPPASSASAPAPSAPAQPGTVDMAAVQNAWNDVLEAVKQRRRVAWMILINEVRIVSVEGNVLTLAFARDGDMKGFTTSGSDAVVRDALHEVLGVSWRIVATSGGDGRPSAPSGPPAAPSGSGPASPPPSAPPSAPQRPDPAPEPDPRVEAGPRGQSGGQQAAQSSPSPADDELPGPDGARASGMALMQRELGATVVEEFDRADSR